VKQKRERHDNYQIVVEYNDGTKSTTPVHDEAEAKDLILRFCKTREYERDVKDIWWEPRTAYARRQWKIRAEAIAKREREVRRRAQQRQKEPQP